MKKKDNLSEYKSNQCLKLNDKAHALYLWESCGKRQRFCFILNYPSQQLLHINIFHMFVSEQKSKIISLILVLMSTSADLMVQDGGLC